MIDSLAFLPCDQVLEGMEYLQSVCPEELVDLLTYFNTNYVSGSFKKLQVPAAIGDDRVLLRMRKVPPLFSVDIRNVHDITLKGGHRTNNSCEAWNHGFHQMIGHDHPSIWVAIKSLKKDQAHVATQLL